MALSFRGNIVGSDVVIGWVSDAGEATLVVSAETSQRNASFYFFDKNILDDVLYFLINLNFSKLCLLHFETINVSHNLRVF